MVRQPDGQVVRDGASSHRTLADQGNRLRMPASRSLGDGLFEPRFDLQRVSRRITYYFAQQRRIVLLTVFRKQRQNERADVTSPLFGFGRRGSGVRISPSRLDLPGVHAGRQLTGFALRDTRGQIAAR